MSTQNAPPTPPGTIRWDPHVAPTVGQTYFIPPDTVWAPLNPYADVSAAGRRLYWTLQGPLTSAVSVIHDAIFPDPSLPHEHYFRGQSPDGTASWHPISRESITKFPRSSLTVTEEFLHDWQNQWWTINAEGFNDMTGYDPGDREPPTFDPVVVTASNGEFVTIHDFLTTLHPFLMNHRDQLLRAMHLGEDEDYIPTGEERVLIDMLRVDSLYAREEDELRRAWQRAVERNGGMGERLDESQWRRRNGLTVEQYLRSLGT